MSLAVVWSQIGNVLCCDFFGEKQEKLKDTEDEAKDVSQCDTDGRI